MNEISKNTIFGAFLLCLSFFLFGSGILVGMKESEAVAQGKEGMIPKRVEKEETRPSLSCADGFVFRGDTQVFFSRNMPALCGDLERDFTEWMKKAPKIEKANRSLSSLWEMFLLEGMEKAAE